MTATLPLHQGSPFIIQVQYPLEIYRHYPLFCIPGQSLYMNVLSIFALE